MFKVGDKVRRKKERQKDLWWSLCCGERGFEISAVFTVRKEEEEGIHTVLYLEGHPHEFDSAFFEKVHQTRPTSHYFPKEL